MNRALELKVQALFFCLKKIL